MGLLGTMGEFPVAYVPHRHQGTEAWVLRGTEVAWEWVYETQWSTSKGLCSPQTPRNRGLGPPGHRGRLGMGLRGTMVWIHRAYVPPRPQGTEAWVPRGTEVASEGVYEAQWSGFTGPMFPAGTKELRLGSPRAQRSPRNGPTRHNSPRQSASNSPA